MSLANSRRYERKKKKRKCQNRGRTKVEAPLLPPLHDVVNADSVREPEGDDDEDVDAVDVDGDASMRGKEEEEEEEVRRRRGSRTALNRMFISFIPSRNKNLQESCSQGNS